MAYVYGCSPETKISTAITGSFPVVDSSSFCDRSSYSSDVETLPSEDKPYSLGVGQCSSNFIEPPALERYTLQVSPFLKRVIMEEECKDSTTRCTTLLRRQLKSEYYLHCHRPTHLFILSAVILLVTSIFNLLISWQCLAIYRRVPRWLQ